MEIHVSIFGHAGVLFHHADDDRDCFTMTSPVGALYSVERGHVGFAREIFCGRRSHPEEAFKISKQATQFVKDFISPEGLKAHARRFFVPEMKDYIEGYHSCQGGLQLDHRGYG